MPDQIFISYRRDDAAYVTGHINDLLRKEFGDASVFTDVDNIALGVDFRAVLDETVSQCQVLLAVIGTAWLTVRGQDGQLRLEDPADFVRIEIESALKRNIPVIPLLVSGATMPTAEDLPDSLKELAFRNGTQIRPGPDFRVDMARLAKNLQRHFDSIRTEAGDDLGTQATTIPAQDHEPKEEQSSAEAEVQGDSAAKQSGSPKSGMQVGEEERDRHRAERGMEHHELKKRWVARLWVIAIVTLAGASWYFVSGNQEKIQAVRTAIFETKKNLDTGDDVEANLLEDTASTSTEEMGPPAGLPAAATDSAGEISESDLDVDVVAGDIPEALLELDPELVPESEADTSEITDETIAAPEPDADVAGERSEQPDVLDEPVDESEASLTASDDAASDGIVDGEVVFSPGTQLKWDSSQFISEGVRLAAIGEHEDAIQHFDEAIKLGVEVAFVYKQRGASYQALGHYEEAISDYDEAIRLNSDDVNAYYKRAASYYALEDYASAIADYNAVIEFDSEYVDAYSKRADAQEALENEAESEVENAEENAEAETPDDAVITEL
jgi:tetratricopeptide (TPR) repeat protein